MIRARSLPQVDVEQFNPVEIIALAILGGSLLLAAMAFGIYLATWG